MGDFVTQFYNLEGDTISERKKNFSKLLKAQPVPLNEEDLTDLCPRTYLEKLFLIDVFIHFNLSNKLLSIIKEGNPVFVSKILNRPTILKAAIGEVSAKRFVNDFLPYTSYSLRMKILKKIALFLEESEMDEIIYWVHERYGFNIATKILHKCSSKKIKEYLSNHEVTLKPRQIKLIYDKDPELFETYLHYHKKLTGKEFSHNNFSKYVSQKNPDMWLRLKRERLIGSVKVGRRTSKYIIQRNNSDFFNNIENYSKFLKLNIIVRQLHGNFKEVYFNFFPKNITDLNKRNFSTQLLKFYPKKKQWDLFEEAFMEVHQKNILDNLIYLNSEFLKMFPNQAIRNKWAEIHYDKNKSDQTLKYCDTSKAIPLIKERLNVTLKMYQRSSLVSLLVQNCEENKDLKSLEDVLQYIWVNHRNEDLIYYILDTVNSSFELSDFNENHWNYVNKIIALLRLKNKMRSCSATFMQKYIEFLILQGKPFKNELQTFMRDIQMSHISFTIDGFRNPAIKRQVLIEIIDISTDINESNSVFKQHFLIKRIIEFNEQHPEHYIDLCDFPSLLDKVHTILNKSHDATDWDERYIKQKIVTSCVKYPEYPIIPLEESEIIKTLVDKEYTYRFNDIIVEAVTKHDRSEFENKVLELFWTEFIKYSNTRRPIIRWFFINDPNIIVPHVERLFVLDRGCLNLEKVKLMSHLKFDKTIIDYCTNKLVTYLEKITEEKSEITEPAEEETLDSELIDILSTLLPTNEYIEMVEKWFVPIDGKMEVEESLNKIYLLQCQVAKSFRRTLQPVKVLPTLMKFCLGDYIQSALPSLYSVCYITPERDLHSYIDILAKREVSVKPHALFLSCELLDFNSAVNMLKSTNEDSISVQKHVFSATLKYFRKNPCDELQDMVIQNLNKINKNDVETLRDLVKIKLPKNYTVFYVQKCWYFLESIAKDVNIEKYLQSFLKTIIASEDIIESSPDLCRHIITYYFKQLSEKEQTLENIYRFVIIFLRHQKSEASCSFVFDIISELKEKQKTKPVKKLFEAFYRVALQDIKSNSKIDVNNNYYIELFKRHWFKTFTSTEMFDEHFVINVLFIKCESFIEPENYARDTVIYLEKLVDEYGLHVYTKIKNLMMKYCYGQKNKYLFFYNILKYKNSIFNCILILDFMAESKEERNDEEEVKDFQNKIMHILKTSDDPIVSVYLNSYVND